MRKEQIMVTDIANLHYFYYRDYYGKDSLSEEDLKMLNTALRNYTLQGSKHFANDNVKKVRNCSFSLVTLYPGVLVGLGYEHGKRSNDGNSFIEAGFSFDYVSGLPYIPGASIKGMLRSYFAYHAYIKDLLRDIEVIKSKEALSQDALTELERNLFEANDVYLDAFPVKGSEKKLLDNEVIAHHENQFGKIIVNNLIKIRPEVTIEFNFILNDFTYQDKKISKDQKLKLFKKIMLDMGVGARNKNIEEELDKMNIYSYHTFILPFYYGKKGDVKAIDDSVLSENLPISDYLTVSDCKAYFNENANVAYNVTSYFTDSANKLICSNKDLLKVYVLKEQYLPRTKKRKT